MKKILWILLTVLLAISITNASQNLIDEILEDPIDCEELNESDNAIEPEPVDEESNNCDEKINSNQHEEAIAEENPPIYDVKDEKICRKKREAEKLSNTIRKTIKVKDVEVNEKQKVKEPQNDKVKPKKNSKVQKSAKDVKKVKSDKIEQSHKVKASKNSQQKDGKIKSSKKEKGRKNKKSKKNEL